MSILSNNLTFFRKRRKVSQTKVAEYLGVKRSRYAAWEEDRCEPSIEIYLKLSLYHNLPYNYLYEIDINKKKKPAQIVKDIIANIDFWQMEEFNKILLDYKCPSASL